MLCCYDYYDTQKQPSFIHLGREVTGSLRRTWEHSVGGLLGWMMEYVWNTNGISYIEYVQYLGTRTKHFSRKSPVLIKSRKLKTWAGTREKNNMAPNWPSLRLLICKLGIPSNANLTEFSEE